jgi:hypothetical protein
MSDEKTATVPYAGPSDASRIDLDIAFDIRFWMRKLRVNEEQLRRAVAAVGSRVPAVKRFLVR